MVIRTFIALGSNLGDRARNITQAVKLIYKSIGEIRSTSNLYESAPVGYLDQPPFLNAVCEVSTNLPPLELLSRLKSIEHQLGRQPTFKNGPRTLDLDILLHGDCIINEDNLNIPHPRMLERAFVLKPLHDIAPDLQVPTTRKSVHDLLTALKVEDIKSLRRILPILNSDSKANSINMDKKIIAGILNLTPDSFSDGGRYTNVEAALKQVEAMIRDGADIIDIGGESTRPGAAMVSVEEELSRVIPVIRSIRDHHLSCFISIDTRSSIVAREAIKSGANIINDVSGGKHDPAMLSIAAAGNVPLILMHMRGTPSTMPSSIHATYHDVVDEVSQELKHICDAADAMRIPRWLQIIDPGIGFAKDASSNLQLMHASSIHRIRQATGNRAMMIGMSRKRYLAGLLQQGLPDQSTISDITMEDRDWATVGTCCALADAGIEILRVHNVRGVKSALIGYRSIR